jgi:hypothetical protein
LRLEELDDYETIISSNYYLEGAVDEWSKALLRREKINQNQKIPGSPPAWIPLKKYDLPNSDYWH